MKTAPIWIIHSTCTVRSFRSLERQQGGLITPEPYLAWRDTVNVQPGETIGIATVKQQAGDGMFHRRILEHEDLGMMGMLRAV